ncbi:MAG: TolC family outer membrane protein [Rhodospirillaceae bacterium]|nr:TolC family outer membrane protein [Rhodospirillaceae bacterium]MBT5458777.1 TolC family outer membrane protein [Rhodospirillaceae bacterium]
MSRSRFGVLTAAVASSLCVGLFGGLANAETLSEALAKAYLSNPTLLAARARLRAIDEGVPEAVSGWRPTVSLNYDVGKSYSDTSGGSSSGSGAQNRSPRTGSLSLDQNVYRGGRTQSAIRRAEQDVLAERARLATTEQQIMLDGGTAFVDVLRDEAVLKLNQNNERVLRRQLEATRDRFQVGEVTRTDVAQAESRLARATAERIQSEGTLAQSRAAYQDVMGDFPGTLEPTKPLGDVPTSQKDAVNQARARSPEVITARFTERAAAADIDVVRGELYPTLNLEGDLARNNDTSSTDSRRDAASITARFSLPLYQAGGVSARIRAAKQTHSQRRKELDAAIRTVIASATSAWENYQTAVAQIKAFSAEVRSATIALEGVRQEAQVGSRTVLDVLDAEQELLDARVSLVRAQRDEAVSTFSVRQQIGTLVAARLGLSVPTYDFEAYYKKVRNKWFGWGIGGK